MWAVMQNLSLIHILQNISFDIKKGEIFGFYGLVGAGRTELLETIFGIRTKAEGNIVYDGKVLNFSSPKDAMDHGFALITEERKANGLFLKGDITFNTTIANMKHYKSGVALSHDKMVRALSLIHIYPPDAGMLPADLQPGTCHAQGKL